MPAASAAAAPPLLPPGVRLGSCGLRQGRNQTGVVGLCQAFVREHHSACCKCLDKVNNSKCLNLCLHKVSNKCLHKVSSKCHHKVSNKCLIKVNSR